MSVDHIPNNVVLFIVDTDQYSGNFEREMTGYMTGRHNETHGDREAEVFLDYIVESDLEDLGRSISDLVVTVESEGWDHVCTIFPTVGRQNNGMGVNTDVVEGQPAGYPAYESVAIFFDDRPTEAQITFLKERAHQFSNYLRRLETQPKINIKGFRLQQSKVIEEKIDLPI